MHRSTRNSPSAFAHRPAGINMHHCVVLSFVVGFVMISRLHAQDAADSKPNVPVVEGQIYDHNGRGVADVEVSLLGDATTPNSAPIAVTRTNRYGDFQLFHDSPLAGSHVVTFTKDGYANVTRDVEIVAGKIPPFVEFVMPGARSVTGIVVARNTGSPIAGAQLRASAGGRYRITESADDGTFRFEQLQPGPGSVTTQADGYAKRTDRFAPADDGGVMRIEMDPERIVRVTTVNAVGAPIAGADIVFISLQIHYGQITTDEKGSGVLRGLPRELTRVLVHVAHPDYVSDESSGRSLEFPTDVYESDHQFVLSFAGSVVGTVTDQNTKRLLQGVRVTVGADRLANPPRDWTGFDGAYTITGVRPGYTIVATYLNGYAPQIGRSTVEPNHEARVDFEIHASKDAAGVVVDGDGKPIAGVLVMATVWRGYALLGAQALTGEDGRFVLTSIPDDEFTVSIESAAYEPLNDQRITPGKTDHRFELAPRMAATRGGASLKIGDPFPSLDMVTLDGKPLKTADLKGKTILLDFWATWCGPCITEIPHIVQVQKAFGDRKDFAIISISLDFDSDEKKLRKFIADNKMTWTHVFGKTGRAQETADKCGVEGIPQTFLIAPDGTLKAVDLMGPSLKTDIQRALESPSPKD